MGAGSGCHSSGYSLRRKGAGDFHRPYGDSVFLPVTFIGGYSLRVGVQHKTPLQGVGGDLIVPSGWQRVWPLVLQVWNRRDIETRQSWNP